MRGHSFLPCDRNFGTIKSKIRKSDRVFLPIEYGHLAHNSVQNDKFTVLMIDTDQFINFKDWWPKYYKKNMMSVESQGKGVPRDKKVTLAISQYMEVLYSSEKPGVITTRDYIGVVLEHTFSLLGTNKQIPELPVEMAFKDKNPINSKKIEDLKKILPYIPEVHRPFYDGIIAWPSQNNDENDIE